MATALTTPIRIATQFGEQVLTHEVHTYTWDAEHRRVTSRRSLGVLVGESFVSHPDLRHTETVVIQGTDYDALLAIDPGATQADVIAKHREVRAREPAA